MEKDKIQLIFIKLDKHLDPSQKYCIAKSNGEERYFIANRTTKIPFCAKHLNYKKTQLINFLKYKASSPKDLCLICQPKLLKTEQEEKCRKFLEDIEGIDVVPKLIAKTKDLLRKLPEDEFEIGKRCILEYVFGPEHNNESFPHDFLEIRNSEIYKSGDGIFAIAPFPEKHQIGIYKGKILYNEEEKEEALKNSFYIFEVDFEYDSRRFVKFWIDAKIDQKTYSWPGKFNHKWTWKDDVMKLPTEFESIFATLKVNDDMVIESLRNIKTNEELTIDYGQNYWTDFSIICTVARVSHSSMVALPAGNT